MCNFNLSSFLARKRKKECRADSYPDTFPISMLSLVCGYINGLLCDCVRIPVTKRESLSLAAKKAKSAAVFGKDQNLIDQTRVALRGARASLVR